MYGIEVCTSLTTGVLPVQDVKRHDDPDLVVLATDECLFADEGFRLDLDVTAVVVVSEVSCTRMPRLFTTLHNSKSSLMSIQTLVCHGRHMHVWTTWEYRQFHVSQHSYIPPFHLLLSLSCCCC